jgi:NAD(P)H-hydrate epimerase
MKPGLLLRDGVNCAGRITVHPILIPLAFGPQDGLRCLAPEDLPRLIPPRPRDSHKGTFGRVVLMAGSPGMAGAAAFCANACIRSGAGLTRVLCREGILPVVQTLAPGAVCVPLPEKDGRLVPGAEKIAARELAQADAAAAGCGLGQADDVIPALTAFAAAPCPVVWDADALNLLSAGALPPPGPRAVLTPHPGEAARLLACAPCAIVEDPLAAAHRLQGRYGCTVLLKGARTLMTDGRLDAVNRHGTPAMAKGGSGDVLTGILAALLARRLPCTTLETVQAAALIHGLAGLRAEAQSGENGVTPQQLVEQIRL